MHLYGYSFSGYRSIGNVPVRIAPLGKINLVIGQNNIGKSNIINYLSNILPSALNAYQEDINFKFDPIDKHISTNTDQNYQSFALAIKAETYFAKHFGRLLTDDVRELITLFFKSFGHLGDDGYIWFEYKYSINSKFEYSIDYETAKDTLAPMQWQTIWSQISGYRGGSLTDWISDVLRIISQNTFELSPIELTPAIRKIGEPGSEPIGFDGAGIIDSLAKLQNPGREEREKRVKFDKINKFLRVVLDNKDATIEIPYERDMILVHMDGKILPLTSLGTGIHEVIILASTSTVLDNTILCVEEPELHLHPLLQKKLLNYLSEHTSNQYIFTTHSAHLLDTNGAQIFHVRSQSGKTTVESISSSKEKSRICQDLGYKASDILQANCVIWVEGPSDRIYINFWLKALDDSLVEGVHYSIMFYGGKLFSHLTADDNDDSDLRDFISLRKLNRCACIVFDSDKSSPQKRLNATKKRLQKEFNEGPGFAWVTKGREIENYISSDNIESCVKTVHSKSAKELVGKGQWDNTLVYRIKKRTKKGDNGERTASKVKVANNYIENYSANLTVLDLNEKVSAIRDFIRESNGLES